MSYTPDRHETVTVTEGSVTVRKWFVPEEFPVPAIKFAIESSADVNRELRLVDHIPEWFPMESVGFHPSFESDNWTAYKDHRIEYERTLGPGESVVTVYGVRLEGEADVTDFLVEPILELTDVGEETKVYTHETAENIPSNSNPAPDDDSAEPRFCSGCGHDLRDQASKDYCSWCGASLS